MRSSRGERGRERNEMMEQDGEEQQGGKERERERKKT